MKKVFTLFLTSAILCGSLFAQNERYIDEVFSDVVKLENQLYSINITVVTGVPALDTLYYDLYMPAEDTCTSRPLAVILHTGTFLPRGFVSPTGAKDDYANVQVCERLAKMGYVAASVEYRAGWNPIAPTDVTRRSTIINAAYRSIQDMYAFLRFMNMTVDNLGNPYHVDADKVAIFGIGTGGFVGFNAAVLNSVDEIFIDKFKNPLDGVPFIDTNLVGDIHGIKPGIINIPNHVGFKDDFHFVFGLDGAVGDSTWLEIGTSVPLVAAGTVTHPTTPFGIDPDDSELINCDLPVFAGAGTGTYVVNIAGSACMLHKANELGINDPLNWRTYDDPVSVAVRANANNFGEEHLWAINLPGPQTGPWEYWEAARWDTVDHPLAPVSIHVAALATNPDMSMDKANRYIDTALWYFAPRAYEALKLSEVVCSCDGITPDPVVVNDFECQRNSNFGAGSDRISIINNPQPDADNDSEKVLAYRDPPADPWAALCVNFDTPIDLSIYNQFELQINSPADIPVLFKLEGGTSSPYETWLNTSASGTWETLTADFSSQAAENHTRVCIFANGGVDEPNEVTYLLDNLHWEMVSSVLYPTVDVLHISPNPVENLLYIRNPGNAVQFRLVNALGQTVLDQYAVGQEIVSMAMRDLHQGIYLLGAYNANGKLIANARIIKQ